MRNAEGSPSVLFECEGPTARGLDRRGRQETQRYATEKDPPAVALEIASMIPNLLEDMLLPLC
jgi:hypothetical protein